MSIEKCFVIGTEIRTINVLKSAAKQDIRFARLKDVDSINQS
jgi:hypothetical protein